jgi:hypothetical protein
MGMIHLEQKNEISLEIKPQSCKILSMDEFRKKKQVRDILKQKVLEWLNDQGPKVAK